MNGSLVFKRILFSKKEKDCASRMIAERAGSGLAWCGGGASRALGGASCACEPCVDHGAWSWRREPVGPGGQASRPYCNGTRAWRGEGARAISRDAKPRTAPRGASARAGRPGGQTSRPTATGHEGGAVTGHGGTRRRGVKKAIPPGWEESRGVMRMEIRL